MIKFVMVLLLFLTPELVFGQEPDTLRSDSTIVTQDSVYSPFYKMTKSSTGAIIRSLVLPGWGQFYVENYWKAPLFFGAAASLGGIIYYYHDLYLEQEDLISRFDEETSELSLERLKSKREFYRDNRDQTGLFLLGVYILAAVDAYAGAHLYDFDVSDDLTFGIAPHPMGFVRATLSFKLY